MYPDQTPGPGPQVYNLELHIGKVVLGDRGDYRLEVKAKDTCDSCGFNIDVEGTLWGRAWGPRVVDLGWEDRYGGEAGIGFWRRKYRFRDQGIQNWGDSLQV